MILSPYYLWKCSFGIPFSKFNLQSLEATISQRNGEIEKLRTEKSQFDERIQSKDNELQEKTDKYNELEKTKVWWCLFA